MSDIVPTDTQRFVRAVGPAPDETLEEMHEFAVNNDFPHVGPEVGGWLALLARLVAAERIFEFGSGYGYSGYWFSQSLPDDGEIVLTEFDEDELDMARDYMTRGGFDTTVHFEHGDAMETIEQYDGPFDVVLIDHQKHRYRDAFEAVREKVAPGGVIVADNAMTAGIIEFDKLLERMEGGDPKINEHTQGIAEYLGTVRDDPEFETSVLPLGEGLAVSHKLNQATDE